MSRPFALALAALFATLPALADGIQWETAYPAAQEAAKKTGKPLFLFFENPG